MIPTIPRRYIGLDLARRAATLGMIALLLYGTWYGLVRWIDTLPDPGQQRIVAEVTDAG